MDWTFSFLGLQLPIIETFAALIGLLYIYFEYKANAWMWLFSIIMSMLYCWIYFSQKMYANTMLNIYNLGVSIYGVRVWIKGSSQQEDSVISQLPRKWYLWIVVLVTCLTAALTWVMGWLGESQTPMLDGLTASLSVVGIWMLAKGYYQQWYCWIIADMLYVVMFVNNSMWPSTLLYCVYVIVAVMGLFHWRKSYQSAHSKE